MRLKNLRNYLDNNKERLSIGVILLIGFILRVYLTRFGSSSGDLLVFAEWGERFWDLPLHNFYQDRSWYYTFPTYPPLSNMLYGGLFWLNEHKYVLAEIHNKTKLIPSSFIMYFGEVRLDNPFRWNNGLFMLLKLPGILSDIGIGVIIFKAVKEIKRSQKFAIFALIFYIFNPVPIFISSVWGQSESLIAFFGILSFYLLHRKNIVLSIPLLFVSLYLKPNWVLFIPLYLYLLYLIKPKVNQIIYGFIVSIIIFLFSTYPFSGFDIGGFVKESIITNMLPSSKGAAKLSISAFNFYTTIWEIDAVSALDRVLIPLNYWGWLAYFAINFYVFRVLKKGKLTLESIFYALFIVGMGGYLFLTGMLERYFFPAFPPMAVLMFTSPKKLIWGIVINVVLFLNIIWAFYRRSIHEVSSVFGAYNFTILRSLSLLNVILFAKIVNYKLIEENTKTRKVRIGN